MSAPTRTRTTGVYVVQFPDSVKIGRAVDVRQRMRAHRNVGANRFVAYPVSNNAAIEHIALARALVAGRQLGASERFSDLPFEDACHLVEQTIVDTNGQGAERIEMSVRDLTTRSDGAPNHDVEYGKNIRAAMALANVTQVQLAHAADVPIESLRRRLRGDCVWTAPEMLRVANALGWPIDDLVGRTTP